jgi:hypothetical protein
MSAFPQFPTPDFGNNPRPQKRILWKWTGALTAVLLISLLWQCGSAFYSGYRYGDGVAQRFHEQLNTGQYEEICSEADPAFSRWGDHEGALHFLQQVHRKLGDAGVAKRIRVNVNVTTGGTFVTSEFDTQFGQGEAEETFTWRKRGLNLNLCRYNVQSSLFLKP